VGRTRETVKDRCFEHLMDALQYALDVFAPFGVLHPIISGKAPLGGVPTDLRGVG
jgi:hypothetical protein